MSAEELPGAILKRKAVVYVRQSTQSQVQTNLESQRRQYDLVEIARRAFALLVEADRIGRGHGRPRTRCRVGLGQGFGVTVFLHQLRADGLDEGRFVFARMPAGVAKNLESNIGTG